MANASALSIPSVNTCRVVLGPLAVFPLQEKRAPRLSEDRGARYNNRTPAFRYCLGKLWEHQVRRRVAIPSCSDEDLPGTPQLRECLIGTSRLAKPSQGAGYMIGGEVAARAGSRRRSRHTACSSSPSHPSESRTVTTTTGGKRRRLQPHGRWASRRPVPRQGRQP